MLKKVALALLVFILTACAGPRPDKPVLPTAVPASAVPTRLPTAADPPYEYAPSPTPALTATSPLIEAAPAVTGSVTAPPPLTQYYLSATLEYGRHHLAVNQVITYTNGTGEPLTGLLLLVEPLRYPGVFTLNQLSWLGGGPISDYTLGEQNQLRIPLASPLLPGVTVGLELAYELNLPSPTPNPLIRPIPFGYTARQTNLVDWYPFIPPYVPGQGWLSHPPGYFGEHQVYEMADFQVNIRLADARTDLVIAASAPEEMVGDLHSYHFGPARNFAWSVSHDYKVVTQTVGDVTVMGYAFQAHATAGQAVLNTTVEALQLYSRLFGAYPHRALSVVEADFLDGMEFDGLYFLSNGFYNLYTGTPGEYLVAIAAHETAHQWWYALVGNDQAKEPWLDEALCTYSERLYYENLHPEALDWWWGYRVNYYHPQGKVNGSIYDYSANSQPYRAYRDAVYLNGAVFLEELRKLIGDADFFAFLQDYAAQNQGKFASTQIFFDLLSAHTSQDLAPLKGKFFPE